MKEKYLINARIIDPKNQIDEIGGLIIDTKGLIKAVGKKVANGNLPADTEKIDLKITNVIPGHDDVFINIMNDGIAMYNFHKNYTLINALCNLHKVPFLFSTIDPRIHNSVEHMPHYVGKFDRDIKGIDGEHPSAEKQIELGERFFNKYTEL